MKKGIAILLAALFIFGVFGYAEEAPLAESSAAETGGSGAEEDLLPAEGYASAPQELPAAEQAEESPAEELPEGHAQADASSYADGVTFSGTRTHNSRYARYDVLTGIDVSVFQGTIDWKKVAADGVDFAIIRCGGHFSNEKSGTYYYDTKFEENIKGALENGIEVGVYFFSQAITEEEARKEAAQALQYIGKWKDKLTLPVYLDVEYIYGSTTSGRLYEAKLSKAQQTAVALAFCDSIKAAGLDAGVYAAFVSFNISAADIYAAGYSLWNAHWNTAATLSTWYDVWQHNAHGTVAGISGECDLDYLYRATVLTPMTDVSLSAWYTSYIKAAMEDGLFKGTTPTTFSPENAITREMFVTVLYRMAGSPASDGRSAFSDVVAGEYYEPAVLWAEKIGLTNGMGDGTFGVGREMTRQEMVSFLYRYAGITGLSTAERADISVYSDAENCGEWAREAMRWAVGKGLVQGVSETELSPGGSCTRAQAAAVLVRLQGA